MSQTVTITLAVLDTAEMVSDLQAEKQSLVKVINLLEAVNSGALSASCLVNVDDTDYTVLTAG